MVPIDDDLASDPDKPAEKEFTQITLRLDAEHYAALGRVAGFEKLNGQATLRKLIRIADQLVTGADSPFASRLEHLLTRKAG
jgi:hypothetical protein